MIKGFHSNIVETIILLAAAVLPAVFLMKYIYGKDKADKEPAGLLIRLVFLGVFSTLPALILESMMENYILPAMRIRSEVFYAIFVALEVGLIEEGCKMFFLHKAVWRNPNFNFRFDGIVYAVTVSLGFAAYENIHYVMAYGLGVAAQRALLAVPAHMAFAVFMGAFYGRAKMCDVYGMDDKRRENMRLAYGTAVFLHAFYDACAMIGSLAASLLFMVFVAVMYRLVTRLIQNESITDQRIF